MLRHRSFLLAPLHLAYPHNNTLSEALMYKALILVGTLMLTVSCGELEQIGSTLDEVVAAAHSKDAELNAAVADRFE